VAEGGGLLNRTGVHQTLTKRAKTRDFRPKPPDRDSVLACPDLPFADRITAQFAAPAARAAPRGFWHASRCPAITKVVRPDDTENADVASYSTSLGHA
jgi:hypothetical protein